MTKQEWLTQARSTSGDLLALISAWHPAGGLLLRTLRITAPAANLACKNIANQIRAESDYKYPAGPSTAFHKALEDGDVGTLLSLLSETWFGVPESTDCWNLPGFAKAVELLDDPPEEE